MIMKYMYITLIPLAFAMAACTMHAQDQEAADRHTRYVNTFIGTGGHGHTFPGATTPYGMVQLSPDTRTIGWDACGGYHYSDSSILGFSHTHLSGTGISDLGDVLLMPFTGEAHLEPGTPEDPDSGYRSRFSHSSEQSSPGYYSVLLQDDDILAELTATARTGFHRYTFPENSKAGVIIDLVHTIYPDSNPEHHIHMINDREIAGLKRSGGWAKDQHAFFHIQFNQPYQYKLYDDGVEVSGPEISNSKSLKAVLTFDLNKNDELLVKVGISSVDRNGAKNNLEAENAAWDFDQIKDAAHRMWAEQLSKIDIEGGTEDEKTIFYTALYHTAISPYIFNDVDGRYRGMDQQIHRSERDMYTVFSLWDTFRANHPLHTITDPERNEDFIHSLLAKYEEGGILPKWELNANYTGTMIGSHAIPVIVDAYFKGLDNFDVEKAYSAMVQSMDYDTTGILFPSEQVKKKLMPMAKFYNKTMEYIPADLESESVSKALEYAYNDWCLAQMAKALGKQADYDRYSKRAKRYMEYYDEKTGFMRGKNQDGQWREPFDPRHSRHRKDDYTEGNAFQWSWFVPHDVQGLIQLVGGQEVFAAKLDTLFSTSSELTGDEVSSDISGLIGQYAHGNEPSHHITHMYNFIGQPWKTQSLTDQIMGSLYFNDPNGLAGNEDCGQMSAWYVLNALGFYSFCPGEPVCSIGRPLFDNAVVRLPNGSQFTIRTQNNSPENMYVQSVSLNGQRLDKPFFDHSDILEGGTLEFVMGAEPNGQQVN
jgi:predicted alpha-1,2-mannosidase